MRPLDAGLGVICEPARGNRDAVVAEETVETQELHIWLGISAVTSDVKYSVNKTLSTVTIAVAPKEEVCICSRKPHLYRYIHTWIYIVEKDYHTAKRDIVTHLCFVSNLILQHIS